MKKLSLITVVGWICFLILSVNWILFSQEAQRENLFSLELNESIPIDSRITFGVLDNGLKYFIRENKKPEHRAELRLVVNAGSVLEDEDQRGLAHFVEHMAFNGTKHFAKHELVDYLESIGMKFGPEINAYTSFDETVYMLEVPTDSAEVLEKAIQILEDWAHLVSFDDEEIDKERGVVIEEWRLGRGAGARMQDKQLPILLKGSRYAERLPIGKKEILESFGHDKVRRFYHDWYRPDMMAVIAVGDFHASWIESLMKKYFNRIPAKKQERPRTYFPVPDHQETLFAIATDPEAVGNQVSVYYKMDVKEEKTVADYREQLVEGLYSLMLNQRLSELTKQSNPPFIYAYSGKMPLTRTKQAYNMTAVVKENGIEPGLEAILVESERVKRFGFTKTELERSKNIFMRSMERAYNERDKTESRTYAAEYIRHVLTHEPIPGIEYEYKLFKKYVPGITLKEINRLTEQWIGEGNRVIAVNAPEKPGVRVPTEAELLQVFEKVNQMKITPYVDKVSSSPLIAKKPTPGRILLERKIPVLGVSEWKLSNGIRVVLKPTNFKNDEIRFDAFSPGGHSLASDEDYFPAVSASIVVNEGGLGDLDKIQLNKLLSGKIVSVSPYIAELFEGVSGMASPKDLETMFQLIYLNFVAPRKDTTAFIAYKKRMKGILENKEANPESVFGDTVQVTMAQHHYRARPLTQELLDEMNLEKSFHFYRQRFAGAGDFSFFFVGNFDLKQIKPLVQTYLASLPTHRRKEGWRDVGIRPPKGIVTRVVKKGIEPKSRVHLIFTGPYKYSRINNNFLTSLTDVLQIKLREVLRENLSGTYGVHVGSSISKFPYEGYRISISFGCAPDRVDELIQTVLAEIDSIKTVGIAPVYIRKVKEAKLRRYETNLKENSFWLSALVSAYKYGLDPKDILTYPERVAKLTPEIIQKTAQDYLNLNHYAQFILLPEKNH